jgi:hypothetical protein
VNRASAPLAALALLLASVSVQAADNPVAGTWKLASFAFEGATWTLTVKEQNGKLSGKISGEYGEYPLDSAKLNGNTFTFRVYMGDDNIYDGEGKISGKSMQGAYLGPDGKGTFKGDKQP